MYTSVVKCVLQCAHSVGARACVRATAWVDEAPCMEETPCMKRAPCVTETPCVSGVVASVPKCMLPSTPCVSEGVCVKEETPCVSETPSASGRPCVSGTTCAREMACVSERVRTMQSRRLQYGTARSEKLPSPCIMASSCTDTYGTKNRLGLTKNRVSRYRTIASWK